MYYTWAIKHILIETFFKFILESHLQNSGIYSQILLFLHVLSQFFLLPLSTKPPHYVEFIIISNAHLLRRWISELDRDYTIVIYKGFLELVHFTFPNDQPTEFYIIYYY